MLLLSTTLCLITHILTALASRANSSHTPATGPCKIRKAWRNNLNDLYWFNPTNDCMGLSTILETAKKDHTSKLNFCKVDPDVVFKYINSSLSRLRPDKLPQPCEVRAWFYGNYGGKPKKSFCQNATDIFLMVMKNPKDPSPAHTQPYVTVFHGGRTLCLEKFKADLKSAGEPDLAGPGILCSQITGMVLLLFFHVLAHRPDNKSQLTTTLLKTTRHFYVAATVLSCAITTAALVTFYQRHVRSKALQANWGYNSFYVNVMLALAAPLAIVPAVVLVMMPPKVRDKPGGVSTKIWDQKRGSNVKLYIARGIAATLYVFCIVVMWTIWAAGLRNQHNPTRIGFGGNRAALVSSFIYKHAYTYVFCVCIVMPTLCVAGCTALAILWAWHHVRKTIPERRSYAYNIWRDICRNIFVLFGIAQLSMFAYIRGQAFAQAGGTTAETNWGFGQILAVFTWLPLLLLIASKIGAVCFSL